ncbi:MAG: hypothetical protein H0T17_03105 [Propionibacteriales bacterium]|nr:hypothetical protein [Propionibacteriales bacterium]
MTKHLILVGGAAGTGKTTTAGTIAAELRVGWLQLDSVWIALRAAASPGSDERETLDIDGRLRRGTETSDKLLTAHVAAASAVCRVLPAVLAFELQTHETLVADGAWVLPDAVAGLGLVDTKISAIFLHEPDLEALRRSMRSRRGSSPVQPWHHTSSEVAWHYGNWVAEKATQHGMAVISARPFDTLHNRVRELVTR